MRRHRKVAVALATALALGIVFTAGYAAASGSQQQGVPQKTYVAGSPGFAVTGAVATNWTPVPGLTVTGTWQPGNLLVAHFDAGTTCTAPDPGSAGLCRVRIGLTGPDPGAPNIEFQPAGADTFAMDTATGTAGPAGQAHGVTRYLQVPPALPGTAGAPTPLVWVEVSVTNPAIQFTLNLPVLTVEVVNPTAS